MQPLGNTFTGRILASLYGRVIALRNRHYDVRDGLRTGVPVISIGGIHAGGTGKTPMTIMVAQLLQAQGCQVAILSRGYKRRSRRSVVLRPGEYSDWETIGDEPFMMRSLLDSVWLGICSDRYKSAMAIKPDYKPGKACFVLDDGFQHRRIHRDIDILCLPLNPLDGRLIPSGYLREPVHSLSRAQVLCITGSSGDEKAIGINRLELERLFPRAQCISCIQTAVEWVNALTGQSLSAPPLKNPALVCGIARPERFISMVENSGIRIHSKAVFADHHVYKTCEILRILRSGADGIVTTQKDACRLNTIKNLVPGINLWYLKIQFEFSNASMKEKLSALLMF
jgi:tetraacyldisaccharide 4'-kinase